jgi:hypothetical protein
MKKLCAGLAAVGILAGAVGAWTIQDIRYEARLLKKDIEFTNFKATLESEKSQSLDRILQNNAQSDRQYATQFGVLQQAVQNAKISSGISREPRQLDADELCILEQAERIARGENLSDSCGQPSVAVSSGQQIKD